MRKAAAEGVTDLRAHMGMLIEKVQTASTNTEALKIAAEEFSADGAQRMVVAIRSGALPALDDLVTSFAGSEGATVRAYEATGTWTTKLTELKINSPPS